MERRIQNDFFLVLGLSAFLPFFVSAMLLLNWSASERKIDLIKMEKQKDLAKLTLASNLERIAVVTKMAAESREIVDFLLTPEDNRVYSSNLVVGRLYNLSQQASEISQWLILDINRSVIFPETGVTKNFEEFTGFKLLNNEIFYQIPIHVDDQYLGSGSSFTKGFVISKISIQKLKQSIPDLISINQLPQSLEMSQMDVTLKDSLKAHGDQTVLGIILVLGVAMIGFFVTGIVLLYKRILNPIHKLTSRVLQKRSNPQFSVSTSRNEIQVLSDTFDAYAEELSKNTRNSAIASTVQMLAHDVRKPFSMLKTGLNFLAASANDQNKFKSNLTLLVSEVGRASKSVDGMLTDIMEIGSTSNELIQEPASPETLIEATLGEIFRVYPKSQIAIHYDLNHAEMVNVHVKKIMRVFANIVGNAIQAMNYSGNLWFKTQTMGDFLELCIGNSGSFIPQENRSKLFDAFFTSGKKGGTGLGLAIAQKVVQAHGGTIRCESSKSSQYPDGFVEFYFTLPLAKNVPFATTANLPNHSDDITQLLQRLTLTEAKKSQGQSEDEILKNENQVLNDVLQKAATLSRSLGILIIDDESIYRTALANWIEENSELARYCRIYHGSGSDDAVSIVRNNTLDLIITDIDMGTKSLSGFELVKELRTTLNFKGQIFVHSNRIVPDDHQRAGDLGANGFLPKPMAKGQLFKLILQTIYTLESSSNLIAIVDDEDIFRDQWPRYLNGYNTVLFGSAEALLEGWELMNKNLMAVITDKNLGSGMDGLQLGAILKEKKPDLAIFLSTSEIGFKDPQNNFSLIIDKDAAEEAPKVIELLKSKA